MSWATTDDLLRALARREPIDAPIAVVVAHPDDETAGAGASLWLFRRLKLIHVTDGAPRNLCDAHAAGFATCEDYAAARRDELHAALRIGGVPAHQTQCLAIPDQAASLQLTDLSTALREILRNVAAVLTHAYEGGHPDHDAIAFAVQRAGIPAVEMAGYHAAPAGGIEVGCFASHHDAIVVPLTDEECERRDAMLACFKTQRATLAPFFGLREERFRIAPRYDFTRPATSRMYYDDFDWGMTSAKWCELATKALRC